MTSETSPGFLFCNSVADVDLIGRLPLVGSKRRHSSGMKRLTAIAAGLLLVTPMAANAEQTFLVCNGKAGAGPFSWNITLNETASTVSMTSLQQPETVLGGYAPESVTWKLVRNDIPMVFRLNRLTGEISNRMIVPSSWSKKNKETAKTKSGSGLCNLRQAPTQRKF